MAREMQQEKPLPASPTAYDGRPNVGSNKTLEKLRGLSQNLSARLAEERNAHVVRITTLATELTDVQNETIQELEKHVASLEKRLKFYDDWEESREVKGLIDQNEKLTAEKAELSTRLEASFLIHRP